MSTEPAVTPEQLEAEDERQRIVSLQFRQRHVLDFKPTPENIKKMGDYMTKNNLRWDTDELEAAFESLQEQGTLEAPTPADIKAQSKTVSQQIAESSKPDVPCPQPLDKRSINTIPAKDFRKYLKIPEFRDELNAALKAGR